MHEETVGNTCTACIIILVANQCDKECNVSTISFCLVRTIKPDEIVIADDGWEYDGSSETSLKERNRLVTVSLKTWAIKSVLDVNVMFDSYIAPNSGWHLEK